MINSKRGAIELSMTTIIVIILGVTLLSLGLVFVKTIFDKGLGLGEDILTSGEDIIQTYMAQDDTFYINGYHIRAEQGEMTPVYSGAQFFSQNAETAGTFTIQASGSDAIAAGLTFVYPDAVPAKAGERKSLPFGINVPANIPLGQTYGVTVSIFLDGTFYDSEVILVEVV